MIPTHEKLGPEERKMNVTMGKWKIHVHQKMAKCSSIYEATIPPKVRNNGEVYHVPDANIGHLQDEKCGKHQTPGVVPSWVGW